MDLNTDLSRSSVLYYRMIPNKEQILYQAGHKIYKRDSQRLQQIIAKSNS